VSHYNKISSLGNDARSQTDRRTEGQTGTTYSVSCYCEVTYKFNWKTRTWGSYISVKQEQAIRTAVCKAAVSQMVSLPLHRSLEIFVIYCQYKFPVIGDT